MSSVKQPVVLVICDGWGESPITHGNAIAEAHTPNLDKLYAQWPHTTVTASGEAVGLPKGQIGNSEVGHLTIGSGRVIRQQLSNQHHLIDSGEFYQNVVLITAIEKAIERGSSLHIVGLVSPGGVHSHQNGAVAVAKLARNLGQEHVYIHAFTDGRDVAPASSLEYIRELETELTAIGAGTIASVSGRYYAMDRDNRWERIELAYNVLVGDDQPHAPNIYDHIKQRYEAGETDEFLKPVSIAKSADERIKIEDNDVVVFFNFRPDRARQISHALVDKEFDAFERTRVLKDVHFVSFTEYDPKLDVAVAFPSNKIEQTLAEVVSKHGFKQFHVAETEKYAHVTYFFNGGVEKPFENEERELVPSKKVATYDLVPQMSSQEVTDIVVEKLASKQHELIVVNLANADMVGHTGNHEKTIEAIAFLDSCLGRIANAANEHGYVMLMTADHGNAERNIDQETNGPLTAHTTSPVPVLLCGVENIDLRDGGELQDIAPTILEILGMGKPNAMTGISLIDY